MNSYLQRLLDRTAPSTQVGASVLPAGLSHSPVSLSDQRLNDPGFTDRYAPPAGSREQFDDAKPTLPRPTARRAPQRSTAETTTPEPAPTRPEPVPPQIAETLQEISVPETPRQSLQHPRPAGLVEVSDLILPEPEPATERMEPVPTPPPTAQLASTEVQTEPNDPPVAQPQEYITPIKTPLEFAEVTPSPPRPQTEPVPRAAAAGLTVPQEAPNDSAAAAPRPAVEAMPAPVDVPALPDLPLPTPRRPEPAAVPPPVVQAVQEPPKHSPPAETRRNRPMTATEASIIGQLTPRRRALTIFGLRRR